MLSNIVKSFSLKSGKSEQEVEKIWKDLKNEYGEDYARITGILKKILGLNESRYATFKEFLNEDLNTLKNLLNDDFKKFCEALSFYIEYNDKKSAEELYELKNKIESLFVHKKVYKLMKLDSKNVNTNSKITSTSTKKLTGDILDEMKDTIDQYKETGDFYYVTLSGNGLNVNKLSKYFTGNWKELKSLDTVKDQVFGMLKDTFETKRKQNEFIVFGDFKVEKIEKV